MPPPNASVAPGRLRSLLCKLRDLDLRVARLAVDGERAVAIAGCLSVDAPAEQPLRYLLRWPDGSEEVLSAEAGPAGLDLAITDRAGKERSAVVHLDAEPDESGRLLFARCRARIDPESADTRAIERFLRRLVRGALAAR